MRNVLGGIATKEDFFPREEIIRRIMLALDAGLNIQLTAPRRVGKSSILYNLKDFPPDGYIFEYIDVESARTTQEFYRKIYKQLLRNPILVGKKNLLTQVTEKANHFIGRLKHIKIGPLGEIGLNEETSSGSDFEEELLNFLAGVELNGDKLVIMVDEFPEVLLNMLEDAKGDPGIARSFLQSNRAFRNSDDLIKRVQFIYTGSNSLNVTAAALGSTELINDISPIQVVPLSDAEAKQLTNEILSNYGYFIADELLNYILGVIEWHIPFYYQLLSHEIIINLDPKKPITSAEVDSLLSKISGMQNDHFFDHYVRRLNRVFVKEQQEFVKLFLNDLCQREYTTRAKAQDLANGILDESGVRRVLNILEHDGYITKVGAENSYKFSSPILKNWWQRHEC